MTASEYQNRLHAEQQFEAWYLDWKQRNAAHAAETRRLLHEALSAGRDVQEKTGTFTHTWSTTSGQFIAEAMTANYLTRHLMSRHLGFGYDLLIDGERRRPTCEIIIK